VIASLSQSQHPLFNYGISSECYPRTAIVLTVILKYTLFSTSSTTTKLYVLDCYCWWPKVKNFCFLHRQGDPYTSNRVKQMYTFNVQPNILRSKKEDLKWISDLVFGSSSQFTLKHNWRKDRFKKCWLLYAILIRSNVKKEILSCKSRGSEASDQRNAK